MKSIDAIRIRLKQLIKANGTNYNDLAHKSGVTASTIKTIFYCKTAKSTTVYTISLICGGLGMTVYDFFNDDIFKDVDDLE
ncbi:MAG TPA: helix-turn-helix domain-containing protein [Candidatus Caccovivens faecavium]|nr:helix-turn-helix domain-containing protein [Candidatus Caccovivens faecavium]